jgi:aryl-alcohol dehydrogenase-like predicted oxidoreductase
MSDVELGLGLLSIGRTWGIRNVPPPSREESMELLSLAVKRGIRLFDTAPAYASSESLLGEFLASSPDLRDRVTVSTKMGEFWEEPSAGTKVDHSYDKLAASIESSLKLLGHIDLLQVHKANPDNIISDGVLKAIDFARSCGIDAVGASVSDIDTAKLACASGCYRYIQFPFNRENTNLQPAFEIARKHNIGTLVNRPLAMGKLAEDRDKRNAISDAYNFILKQKFNGWILTGTSSKRHLIENVAAFHTACA